MLQRLRLKNYRAVRHQFRLTDLSPMIDEALDKARMSIVEGLMELEEEL